MRVVFFSYFFPPDLSAGSFRAESISKSLAKKLDNKDELHVITTHPHRYSSHQVEARDFEEFENIVIHRIRLPTHKNNILMQVFSYLIYVYSASMLIKTLKPNFYIVTTGRLMSGIYTYFLSLITKKRYFVDMRDIFSEAMTDLIAKKSHILGKSFHYIISFLEKKVLMQASGVNVVSEGFIEYFDKEGLNTSSWTVYTNGIDDEFIGIPRKKKNNPKKIILYAGNIGAGQGLQKIIPNIAKNLDDNYLFRVVGDGNTKHLLEKQMLSKKCNNVELLLPVARKKLISLYQDADILFLHLNNIPAFGRFLPSKIFEYAAMRKPIVAGLLGYSKEFVENNVPNSFTFESEDYHQALLCIKKADGSEIENYAYDKFIQKYSRLEIMSQMSDHLAKIIYEKI